MHYKIVKDFKSSWLAYTASLEGITVKQAVWKYNYKYKLDDLHNKIAGKEAWLESEDAPSGYGYRLLGSNIGIHRCQIEVKEQ